MAKKVNTKIRHYLLLLVLLSGLTALFYSSYDRFSLYRREKNITRKPSTMGEVIAPVAFFSFRPSPREAGRYALFTQKKTEIKKPSLNQRVDIENFSILGVVKQGPLYLVVRIRPEGRIKLFPRGSTIMENHTIKELTTRYTVIKDKNGRERRYKIFEYEGFRTKDEKQSQNKVNGG